MRKILPEIYREAWIFMLACTVQLNAWAQAKRKGKAAPWKANQFFSA